MKNKKFHIMITVLLIIICIVAAIVQVSLTKLDFTVSNIKKTLETTERVKVSDSLIRFASSVERDFADSGIKSNRIPIDIFRNNINKISKENITNIQIINSGYSASTQPDESAIDKLVDSYPKKYSDMIRGNINTMLTNIKGDNNVNLHRIVEDTAGNICSSSNYLLDPDKLYNSIVNDILVTNSIVINTNDQSGPTRLTNDELGKILDSKNNIWSEWTAIPEGHLGVNNESLTEDGKPNVDYNKYYVIATLDNNSILSAVTDVSDNIMYIGTSLVLVFILISVAALLLCMISFYKKINGGVEIEPIISTKRSPSIDDDDFYKLFCSIQRYFKQICKRQDDSED